MWVYIRLRNKRSCFIISLIFLCNLFWIRFPLSKYHLKYKSKQIVSLSANLIFLGIFNYINDKLFFVTWFSGKYCFLIYKLACFACFFLCESKHQGLPQHLEHLYPLTYPPNANQKRFQTSSVTIILNT